MKDIILISDFHDYYDHEFASRYDTRPTLSLDRSSRNLKIKRSQMLEWGNKNFTPVLYGYDKSNLDGIDFVVEHTDEYAHAGAGKQFVELVDAKEDTLKVEYIGRIDEKSQSRRHLYIGNHCFVLQYTADGWQSNAPGCSIELLGVYPECREKDRKVWRDGEFLTEYPLLAFDFIATPDYCSDFSEELYLLDINTSPSWNGTFLQEMLHPAVVYKWIKGYMNEHCT